MSKQKIFFAGAVVAAAVSFGAPDGGVPNELTLPVGTVRLAEDRRTSLYPGRVVSVQQVNVVPQVSGEILEVGFDNGAIVKAGDLLYRLDPVKYEAAVKNAEAKVQESKASVAYAELSYARHKTLLGSRAVSQDAVDNALTTRDTARANLAAAQADLTVARDNLKHCRITAPIAGKLGSTLFTKGNYVTTSSGTLVTLIQSNPVRVRFSISSREFLNLFGGRASRVRDEAKITLLLANGETYPELGQAEYVDNQADETTDTLQIFALFPNADRRLRPGGTVSVTLAAKKGAMLPAIPPTAVLQDTQGPYVWALDAEGRAERRTIARGEAVGGLMFVEKGLKAGERFVADGAHKVRRGMKITPAPETAP